MYNFKNHAMSRYHSDFLSANCSKYQQPRGNYVIRTPDTDGKVRPLPFVTQGKRR